MSISNTAEITPFTIDIPQSDLEDLRQRLERTRFAADLPDAVSLRCADGVPEGFGRLLEG